MDEEAAEINRKFQSHPLYGKGPKFKEDGTIDLSIFKAPSNGDPCEGCIRNRRPGRCGHRKANKPTYEIPPEGTETPPGLNKAEKISVVKDYTKGDESVVESFFRKPMSTPGKLVSTVGIPQSRVNYGRRKILSYHDTEDKLVIRCSLRHFTVEYHVNKGLTSNQRRQMFYANKIARKHTQRKNIIRQMSMLRRVYYDKSDDNINQPFRLLIKPLYLITRDLEQSVKHRMLYDKQLMPYAPAKHNMVQDLALPERGIGPVRRPKTRSYGNNVTERLLSLGEIERDYVPFGLI